MSGFRLPFPIFGFIAQFPKKSAARFPWFRKKLGPILHPRSCRSFAVAPFQPRISLHYMLLIFQHMLLPTVPQSKVLCNHGVFSYVWETSWSWFKKSYISKGFGTWENMPQNAPQLRQHPVPNRRGWCWKISPRKMPGNKQTFFIPFGWKQRPINTSACRYVAKQANKKVKFHHLRPYRYDPLRSRLAVYLHLFFRIFVGKTIKKRLSFKNGLGFAPFEVLSVGLQA